VSDLPMIVIIDDDEDVRVAAENLILSLNMNVQTFESAEDFLESSAINEATCLISDMQMPGMSGLDLQARLKLDGHDVPIIFITAFPDEGLRRKTLEAGALEFFSKPFDGNEMIACIDKAIAQH
jgi:FixJ family two-component response regulator